MVTLQEGGEEPKGSTEKIYGMQLLGQTGNVTVVLVRPKEVQMRFDKRRQDHGWLGYYVMLEANYSRSQRLRGMQECFY